MGIAGHIGFAFDPDGEAEAIIAVTSDNLSGEPEWLARPTHFGVHGDNWQEIDLVLQKLAANDSSLGCLAKVITGSQVVGEGPITNWVLHRADDIREMAAAFDRVTERALCLAVEQTLVDPVLQGWTYPDEVKAPLKEEIRVLGREIADLAKNGWAMIGCLC